MELLVWWLCAFIATAAGERTFSLTLVSSNSTPGVFAAVQSAVEQLNSNHALNFTLELVSKHAECDHRGAQRVFYESLLSAPDQLAVVGAGCSEASVGVAEVATYYNTPMISYSSTSEELGLRDEFPLFLRTVPSDNTLTTGVTHFIATYSEWSRVVLLTQDTEQYKRISINMVSVLQERNITVRTSLILPKQLNETAVAPLFPLDNRIFILNMEPDKARFVICEAIKRGLGEYRYVWVLQGWYTEGWWEDTSDVQCNSTTLASFLESQRAVTVGYYPPSLEDSPADLTGTVASSVTSSVQSSAPYAYDAVLALALALNQTLENDNDTLSIQQLRESLLTTLNQLSPFQGLSGRVEFERGNRVIESLTVHQYRDCNGSTCFQPVGVLSVGGENTSVSFLPGESREGLWEGTVPSDGTPIVQENFVYLWLLISSYSIAGLVILGAIVSMIFTFKYRDRTIVKLTSPNLNQVIAFGVIYFNCSVFMFVYPPVSESVLEVFCAGRVWFLCIGVSLCFSTISAKMWRIYYIFHNPFSNKRPFKDWVLFLIVMLFVASDVLILSVTTAFENARLRPERMPDVEHSPTVNEEGFTVMYEVSLCVSETRQIWIIIVFFMKILIQLIGTVFALLIRNVKIKVLNDAKEIAATLYITTAALVTVILISLALSDRLNVYSACYGYGVPLASSLVLVVVFFTKMARLARDPKAQKIFEEEEPLPSTVVERNATLVRRMSRISFDPADLSKMKSLEKQVKSLQRDVSKYKTRDKKNSNSSMGTVVENPVSGGGIPGESESGNMYDISGLDTDQKQKQDDAKTLLNDS